MQTSVLNENEDNFCFMKLFTSIHSQCLSQYELNVSVTMCLCIYCLLNNVFSFFYRHTITNSRMLFTLTSLLRSNLIKCSTYEQKSHVNYECFFLFLRKEDGLNDTHNLSSTLEYFQRGLGLLPFAP